MKNLIKTNREMVASEYFNNHIDDSTIYDEVCFINNHWEDFLEGDELKKVKAIEEFLNRVEDRYSHNDGYLAPSLIEMYIDDDGDVVVAGNESWALKHFDADTKMENIINYLVEQLVEEKDDVLSAYEITGYDYVDDYFTNLESYEDAYYEYLENNEDVSQEEFTLEEYARAAGYETIEEYFGF